MGKFRDWLDLNEKAKIETQKEINESVNTDELNSTGIGYGRDFQTPPRRLLSQAEADQNQPLLSPLYYTPGHAALRRSGRGASADLAEAIPQILDQKPAMIVMADVGTVPDGAREKLIAWMRNGGTLVRFAGSHLATAENDEDLLPVLLPHRRARSPRRHAFMDRTAGFRFPEERSVPGPLPAE